MVHASLQSTGAKLAMVAFRVADRHKSISVGLIVYLTILEDINWSQVDLGGPRATTVSDRLPMNSKILGRSPPQAQGGRGQLPMSG